MKCKILYVIDNLEYGGGERGFAQVIGRLDQNTYDIWVAAMSGGHFENELRQLDIIIKSVDFTRQFSLKTIFQLVSIMKGGHIQLVHSQGVRADFFARLAAKIAKVPYLVSTVQMPVEGYDVHPLKKSIYIALNQFSEHFVNRFIVVSETLRHTLIERHRIEPEKIVKIYNGIEIDEYKPNNERGIRIEDSGLRKEFGFRNDVPVIGTIGRLVWQKGFEYLIKAIPKIVKDLPEAKFLIVGEGPLREKLEELGKRLKVKDNIIFTGFRSDIKEILASIDVLVMPSLLEGLPMVLLEGMAMAKPIVATNIDGISEVLENGKTGLLVPPKDTDTLAEAIIEILNNKRKASHLGQNARKMVEEKFSVEKMVEQIEWVYEGLLNEKGLYRDA